MLKCLGLGMLLLVACSSESGLVSSESVGGADGGHVGAGTSGASTSPAGGAQVASAGASAGSRTDAGEGGQGDAGSAIGGGGAAGTGSEEAGAAGTLVSAGAGGATGNAGATSVSGAAGGGGAGSGGATSGSSGSGSASAGAGGTTTQPDPCSGKKPWDPTERWTDYEQGDQRAFGGVLWHCQVPSVCTAYPGHSSSPGWFKDADCKGGPTGEVAACQCASGQCCDGCYVRPTSHFCGEVVRTAQCLGPVVTQCGGATDTIDKDWWNLFCNGAESATCSRWGAHTKYSNGDCPSKTGCVESGDQASCVICSG